MYALVRQAMHYRGAALAKVARVGAERVALFSGDLVALTVALFAGVRLVEMGRLAGQPPILSIWMQYPSASHFIAFFSTAVLLLYWFASAAHYSRRTPFWEQTKQIIKVLITGFFTELALLVLLSSARIDWLAVITSWTSATVLLPIARIYVRKLLLLLGLWRRDAVIVGTGENARSAYAAISGERLMGYDVQWFARTSWSAPNENAGVFAIGDRRYPIIDLSREPAAVLSRLGNPEVVIALDNISGQESLVWELGAANREALVIPAIRGLSVRGSGISQFFGRGLFLLHVRNSLADYRARFIKRAFDITVSLLLIVLLIPLWIFIGFFVSRDKGPMVYGHMRIGQGRKKFACLKFRSMVPNADRILRELLDRDPGARAEWAVDYKLKNDPRITGIGAFLRKTSLDELPQVFNVLRGDMSLVGPRPIVEDELKRYGDDAGYYLQVKPGITGIWQVSGRNDVDYASRVAFDAWYVKNWSLWTDVVILLRTIRVVLTRVGAY